MRIKPCRRFSFSVCKPESEQVLETSCRQSTAANPFWDGDWSLALQACLTHMYSWHAYLNILSKGLARNHVESCTLVVIFFVRSRLLLFSLVGQHTHSTKCVLVNGLNWVCWDAAKLRPEFSSPGPQQPHSDPKHAQS